MSGPGSDPRPVYLLQGSDPALVSQALSALLEGLTTRDPGGFSPVEEYGEPTGREEPLALGPVLDACRTPPFLAERRLVVVRSGGGLEAGQVKELVAYLADPLDSTVLVLALSGRAAPAALVKAVKERGSVVEAEPGNGSRARSAWLAEHLRSAPVRLDEAAATRLDQHLGEDLARLDGILAALAAAYGPGSRVGPEELEPFLGEAGGVAPWDLTDALDKGNGAGALAALQRMLGGGERHPLQVLATLHRHYGAMLRLDGAEVTDDQGAALLTGMSRFPAQKALSQSRRLGHDRVARAVQLLASADLDLRGRLGWPSELVMEVLVARLAQLARLPGTGAARSPARQPLARAGAHR